MLLTSAVHVVAAELFFDMSQKNVAKDFSILGVSV